MASPAPRREGAFEVRHLGDLEIVDDELLQAVPHYDVLKAVVAASGVAFRVMPEEASARSDQALLLNVVFWDASLVDDVIERPAVGAYSLPHIAWHYLASRELRRAGSAALSVDAQILGEAIASAFDLFTLGHLLRAAPTHALTKALVDGVQGPALAAGRSLDVLRGLLAGVRDEPEAAFADLRELLFVATRALYDAETSSDAFEVLQQVDEHPLGCVFFRHRVADWLLQIRASKGAAEDPETQAFAAALGEQPAPIAWLLERWLRPEERAAAPVRAASPG